MPSHLMCTSFMSRNEDREVGWVLFFFSFFSFLQIRSYIPYLLNLIFLIDIFFSSVVVALNQN